MNKIFIRELDAIKRDLFALAAEIEKRMDAVFAAIGRHDAAKLLEIIASDREIDLREIEIEEECLKVLALHQPVARDLRFVVAVMKINNDLERIGDEAKKIAIKGKDLNFAETPIGMDRIDRMAQIVCEMLRSAIDAFVRHDTSVADQLATRDDEVDKLRDELIAELVGRMSEHPKCVSSAMALIFVIQSMERVGDHAKNVAEYVITVVEGVDPRHRPKAVPAA